MAAAGARSLLDRAFDAIRWVAEAWALVGGLLLVAVVLVNAVSLAGNILLSQPVPGDFEIVEVGVAVAIFAFLPYCQLTDANVTADIFTAGANRFWQSVFVLVASAIALGFSVILLWRMWFGLLDFRTYEEVTTIYQFPLWIAYLPILASLALLVLASLVTLVEAARGRPELSIAVPRGSE
ncbi:TRAP-type C4-dicarboxylate transport system, small permease component [Tistlia consotensis]|uniref:TRAP transporter small permease protein n=1 Tax=Tistlia consotensis USBA 355 TaxID=560819 RepID=A0A1Y6CN83_9PROT|nr:TRAP transporter small permease subunit [Tistlia consotensis]SMF77865.1 TRAP-type C4-dicarboxylate transport system, small permease component [Tistlia consotensis USBA 355]SNS20239.1 TRAP-type C4-dicarboxylate transport system, small permease component [Tistlia consotensis]